MQSRISCFNGAVYRKTLARCWPLWAGMALILFFMLPFSLANARMNGGYSGGVPAAVLYNLTLSEAASLPLPTCLFGLVTAGATFSYLFKKRDAGMMAALPLRREGLFCSGFLAGLTMLLTPGLLAAAIAAVFSAANGQPDLSPVLTWLGVYAAEAVTFYAIGVFCAMLTGQILVLPCLYVLINLGGWLLRSLLQLMARMLLIGVPNERTLDAFAWLDALSPLPRLLRYTGVDFSGEFGKYDYTSFYGWGTVGIYLAAGAVLAALAFLLFRRRKMECAQEPVSVRWLGPVLKYIVTFFCALGLPGFLALFFGKGWFTGTAGLIVFVVLGALIGYLISEMILRKSVRVVKSSWKGLLITAAVAVAVIGAMKLDVFGYVHRVPDPDEIERAELQLYYDLTATVTDPADLEALTRLHSKLIDAQEPALYGERGLLITYHLKNGGTMVRAYDVYDSDTESQSSEFLALMARNDLFDATCDLYHPLDEAVIENVSISWTAPLPGEEDSEGYTGMYFCESLSAALAEDLLRNGILPDLEAGAFPNRTTAAVGPAAVYYPSYPMVDAELQWETEGTQSLHYDITPACTHTLAWFAAHGYEIPGVE